MMGSYQGLLERLDKALGIQAPPVVMVALLEFVEGVLLRIKGWRDYQGFDCVTPWRRERARAGRKSQAEANVSAVPNGNDVVVLCSYNQRDA
jgi:hypothetical protein